MFGIFTCTQMLMHTVALEGCTDTVKDSALEFDSGRRRKNLPYGGLESVIVLRLAFQSDAPPTEPKTKTDRQTETETEKGGCK